MSILHFLGCVRIVMENNYLFNIKKQFSCNFNIVLQTLLENKAIMKTKETICIAFLGRDIPPILIPQLTTYKI